MKLRILLNTILIATSITIPIETHAQYGQTGNNTEAIFGSKEKIPFSLSGDIYYVKRGTKKLPKNFKSYQSKGKIHTNTLNITPRSFNKGFPGISKRNEWFAIDYHGYFYIEENKEIIFSLQSDDGSKLIIDGKTIINHDGQHSPSTKYAKITLKQGIHKINIPYFQGPRYDLALVLSYKENGEKKFTIFNFEDFAPVHTVEKISPVQKIEEDILEEISDSLVFTVEINSLVLFDFNKAELKANADFVLNEIYCSYAENKANTVFVIEGHSDDMGSDTYNLNLSERRAQCVANHFLTSFPMDSRIHIIAYGESKPKVENSSDENRAQNRRVEIQVMNKDMLMDYMKKNTPE